MFRVLSFPFLLQILPNKVTVLVLYLFHSAVLQAYLECHSKSTTVIPQYNSPFKYFLRVLLLHKKSR